MKLLWVCLHVIDFKPVHKFTSIMFQILQYCFQGMQRTSWWGASSLPFCVNLFVSQSTPVFLTGVDSSSPQLAVRSSFALLHELLCSVFTLGFPPITFCYLSDIYCSITRYEMDPSEIVSSTLFCCPVVIWKSERPEYPGAGYYVQEGWVRMLNIWEIFWNKIPCHTFYFWLLIPYSIPSFSSLAS